MVAKFKKREKLNFYQNLFFSIAIGALLLIVIGFLVISSLRINQKRSIMVDKIESLKEEIQALDEKNKKLRAGLIETEKESYWEEKAREQGYKKPGEEAVVVLPSEEKKEEVIKEEKGFLEKILEKLGF